jgi:hypothetical protein
MTWNQGLFENAIRAKTANETNMADATSRLKHTQADWHGADIQSNVGLRGAMGANYMSEANHRNAMSPLLQQQQTTANSLGTLGLNQANRFDSVHDKGVRGINSMSDLDIGRAFLPRPEPYDDKAISAYRGENRVQGVHAAVDTEPYMLADGEAVLNAHAAEKLGRDKIAKLNAEGRKSMGLRGKSSPVVKDGVTHAAVGADKVNSMFGRIPPRDEFAEIRYTMPPEPNVPPPDDIAKMAKERTKGEQFGYDLGKKVKNAGAAVSNSKLAKLAGKATVPLGAGLSFIDAVDNGYKIADPEVAAKYPNLTGLGEAALDTGAASAKFVDIVPSLFGVKGSNGMGFLESKYDDALRSMAKSQGVGLYRRNDPPLGDSMAAQLDANSFRNEERRNNDAVNQQVPLPEGYKPPNVREREKKDLASKNWEREAGLRGALAMISMSQVGGNQQAGLALKNLMDADKAKMDAQVELLKAGKDKSGEGLSVGDIEKLITNTYGEHMVQPVMRGAEQLRHIDMENARKNGDEVLARKLASAELDQSYITRSAQAIRLQSMPSSGEQAAWGTAGGAGLGALAGGAYTAVKGGMKDGFKGGMKDGFKAGMKRGLPGMVGGAILGGLAGGTQSWFSGTNHAPAELGLDPYRAAEIRGNRVVFFDGNTPVGDGPLADVPRDILPQLLSQSN